MPFDLQSLPPVMADLLVADMRCLKEDVFFYFLEAELSRARRYNFFVSLLLVEIRGGSEEVSTSRGWLADLASALNASLRKTDLIGGLGEARLGIVAPHSDLQTAKRIVARLQNDSFVYTLRQHVSPLLKSGCAVYPRDATSLVGLVAEAEARLENGASV